MRERVLTGSPYAVDPSVDGFKFECRCFEVNPNPDAYGHLLTLSESIGEGYSEILTKSLRPCFSLKPNVSIGSGDGLSETTAYTLGV